MDAIQLSCDKRPFIHTKLGEEKPAPFHGMVGKSECMQDIYSKIDCVAQNGMTVLINGESGTGKELVARAIHDRSSRSPGPFLALNLGALTKDLVASELFGHEKGSFTGALERKEGLFESTRGGTLFLDEVGSLDLKNQVILLRVLENKEYRPVGGKRTLKTDARIIAATNINLLNQVQKGFFRKDLYYRLEAFTLNLPPLKDRRQDIPLLATHFITLFNKGLDKEVSGITEEAMEYLLKYTWPGNVRELKNVIQRAMILSNQTMITPADLPPRIAVGDAVENHDVLEIGLSLKEIERRYIKQTLHYWCRGNKVHAARTLGISRRALYNKIERYNL